MRSLRERIGIVPQAPVLFPASLEEKFAMAGPTRRWLNWRSLPACRGHALPAAAEVIGNDDRSRGQLSEGQAQRGTIARALLRDARIISLDEPTASLDAETEAFVMSGIEQVMKDRTTFVIAHRLSTVRRADLVLVLENGKLVEQGTYETLRSAGGLFQRLHDAQFLFTSERRHGEQEAT